MKRNAAVESAVEFRLGAFYGILDFKSFIKIVSISPAKTTSNFKTLY